MTRIEAVQDSVLPPMVRFLIPGFAAALEFVIKESFPSRTFTVV